jgi:hypothetical protein
VIARYIDRGPIAESKISITDDIITYETPRDRVTHEFTALEFLARLTPHIPNKWEQTNRFFGHYSARARGKRKKLGQQEMLSIAEPPKKKPPKTWAALIKRVFEVDPLICRKCRSQMHIKEFFTADSQISIVLKALGLTPFTKPQPIRGPPKTFELNPDYLNYLASQD